MSLFPLLNSHFCLSHPFSSPLPPHSLQLASWAAQGSKLKWSFLYRNWSFIREANRNISNPFIYDFLMSVTNKSRWGTLCFLTAPEVSCLLPASLLFLWIMDVCGGTVATHTKASNGVSISITLQPGSWNISVEVEICECVLTNWH